MIPSWYDVLGVEQDATPAEIRAAWKAAVADLDPTDRRFKQRNRAAEVLLDPERRAAHDAELAADDDLDDPDGSDDPAVAAASAPAKPSLAKQREPAAATAAAAEPATDSSTGSTTDSRPGAPLLLAVLAVLAALLLAASVVSLANGGGADASAEQSGADGLPDARDIAAAQAAAETAIVPVLSYDYRDLEASKQAALVYLSDDYSAEYLQNFEGYVEGNAESTKTVVTAQVLTSGIVRTGEGRVDVLVFVNRPFVNASVERTSRDQVTVRMVQDDDAWLVDCLITMPGGVCGS